MTHARLASAIAAEASVVARRRRAPEPEHRRTHQKLRRASVIAGGAWEDAWRNPQDRGELRELARAARRYDERTRKTRRRPGFKNGELGHVAIDVLDYLVGLAAACRGRVFPSLDTIAAGAGHAVSAVVEALKRLKRAGLVDWQRRYEEVEGQGHERGPQVKQATNIYRLSLPDRIRWVLGVFTRRPPMPDDEVVRLDDFVRRERDFARQEMEARPAVARALARAGRQRE
jgi:hypothetical protein